MAKRSREQADAQVRRSPARHDLPPVHPGEVLRVEFLEPLGLNAARLASGIGISAMHVGRILKGSHGVTPETALRLARFLGTPASRWVELQARYDLDAATRTHGPEIDRTIKPHKSNDASPRASVKKGK
jgi:addiction module HigA family antidote